jgi:hypothetical protein
MWGGLLYRRSGDGKSKKGNAGREMLTSPSYNGAMPLAREKSQPAGDRRILATQAKGPHA